MHSEVELADGYDGIDDVVDAVIENCVEAQDTTRDDLEIVPITAIDEAEMPEAIENADDISQEAWDDTRARIRAGVEGRGYRVD